MTLNPEVQEKAQAELDALTGGSLPTAAMLGSTPYLEAILLESLRWQPSLPFCKRMFLELVGSSFETMSGSLSPFLVSGRYL